MYSAVTAPEILDIDEGTCQSCKKIGKIFEAIVHFDVQCPGEYVCLCSRCLPLVY